MPGGRFGAMVIGAQARGGMPRRVGIPAREWPRVQATVTRVDTAQPAVTLTGSVPASLCRSAQLSSAVRQA